MTRYLIITLTFFCFSATESTAQKPRKKDLIPIENLIMAENYPQAIREIQQLQINYPNHAYLQLIEGICLLNTDGRIQDAIPPLLNASKQLGLYSSKNDHAIRANYHLGQAYHLSSQFNKALQRFEQLQKAVPPNRTDIHEQLRQQISYCKNAIELSKHPVHFRITNLGKSINSRYDEHSPVVSGDESLLLFTSNRKRGDQKGTDTAFSPENIYARQWADSQWDFTPGTSQLNTNQYDATCSLSADGQSLIIYRNEGNGDLFLSELNKDQWSSPQKLTKPINSSYEESHASLSLDGNSIVFTSNRPGGYGGMDIYLCQKLPDGSWGPAKRLSDAINTPLNEESPFLSYDGQLLYFASEGHTSMGGYDIFKCEKDSNGNWGQAINIGYPINTPGDDLFYFPTTDGQRVYFASERNEGFGRTDLYIIEFPEDDERSLAVVAGYLFTEEGKPASSAVITINKKENGQLMGTYRPQSDTGKYTLILPTGVSYQMTIDTPDAIRLTKDIEIPYQANYTSRTKAIFLHPMLVKKKY
ncbi:hypothetical protein [Carboxylicivirga taeanensis]|uniref:hypothetical protein n=1 Tax=Carboxylicivirga taeanensis TaxID=1416875 RepID=UPI003F6DB34B